MNDPTIEPADDIIIERLRSALDEVHRTEPSTETNVTPRIGSRRPVRWAAAAASIALVIAGVAVVSTHQGRHVAAPAPDTSPTTTPTTVATSTTLDLGLLKASWYRLDLADFTPGAVHTEVCCPPLPSPGPATVVAWGDVTGIEHGLLLLTATPPPLGGGEPTLEYTFSNMTQTRASVLEAKVVPGSGLPYVLDDPTMQLLGSGLKGFGTLATQTYTSGGSSVTLSAGDYRGQLAPLVNNPLLVVTFAGVTGYRMDDDLGTTIIWRTPGETWATLHVDIALSRRIEEIVGSLRQAPFPSTTPDPAPAGDGQVLQGSAIIIDTGKGPMLAWMLRESLPPQGGDLPLSGFDWAQVVGEQTVGGTTWGGPYVVTGTWDGAHFVLHGPPYTAPTVTLPAPVMTEGCTLATMAPMIDALGSLDYKALHIVSTSDWNYDGHCGVKITAAFDSPQLQEAAAKVGTDVSLEFELHVVQPPIGQFPAVVVAHAVAANVGLDAAVWGNMLDPSKDIVFASSPESEAFVPGSLALAFSNSPVVSDELMKLRPGDEIQWRWENGSVETLVVLLASPPANTSVPLTSVLLLQARAPDGSPFQLYLRPKP